MDENMIATIIIDRCIDIHKKLGPGLLESAYERVLARELRAEGLTVESQKSVPLKWEGEEILPAFRADLIVNGKVLIELKSLEVLAQVHHKQTLTYLKLSDLRLGLLINFGQALMKTGIRRIVNNL